MKIEELKKIMKKEGNYEKFSFFGYDCFAKRGPLGVWCGYVRLPETHALYKKEFLNFDIECHGGLSFSEYGLPDIHEEPGWFIGFDCAHGGDLVPTMYFRYGFDGGTYKTKEYVIAELKSIVMQLRKYEMEEFKND